MYANLAFLALFGDGSLRRFQTYLLDSIVIIIKFFIVKFFFLKSYWKLFLAVYPESRLRDEKASRIYTPVKLNLFSHSIPESKSFLLSLYPNNHCARVQIVCKKAARRTEDQELSTDYGDRYSTVGC